MQMDGRFEVRETRVQQNLYLEKQVDAFALLTSHQRKVLLNLFSSCISKSFSEAVGEINVALNSAVGGSFGSLLVRNEIPAASLVLNIAPRTSEQLAQLATSMLEHSRHYAVSGIPVLSSCIRFVEGASSEVLFSMDISADKQTRIYLDQPHYSAFVVNVEGGILEEYQLHSKIQELKSRGEQVYVEAARRPSDYGVVLSLANQFGYRASVNADLFADCLSGSSFIFIVSSQVAASEDYPIKGFKAVQFAELVGESGHSVVKIAGSSAQISSLLIGEVILKAKQYKEFEEIPSDFSPAMAQGDGDSCYENIQDMFADAGLFSHSLLKHFFDGSTGLYKTNTESIHGITYISMEGKGRYLTSLESFVSGEHEYPASECMLRMVLNHEIYGAKPSLAVLKVLEGEEASPQSMAIVQEIRRTLDMLSIECKVEFELVEHLSSQVAVGIGLVSLIEANVSPVMGGFKSKGDLIYKVNLLAADSSNEQDMGTDGSLLRSRTVIKDLVKTGFVNAITPIHRGGLFLALYTMAECHNLGFDITGDDELSFASFLLKEEMGQAVMAVSPELESNFVDYIKDAGIPVTLLGHVTKGELRIDDHSYGFIVDLKKKVSFAFQNNIKEMASKKIVKPYGENPGSKKEQVANMFDNIAPKYDFLNHFLSLGIDKIWRRKLVKEVGKYSPLRILDIATGTGDLAIALAKLRPQNIVGLDISVKMVEVGVEKVKSKKLEDVIFLKEGDSESIQFDSNTFDFATVAFGVRNFENPLLGLTEMHRVLKAGGGIAVLEFAMPTKFPIKQLYKFYFFKILPAIGRLFSKDRSAYTYLPESVEAFPSGEKFTDLLKEAGFTKTRIIPLTLGVANIYIGEK